MKNNDFDNLPILTRKEAIDILNTSPEDLNLPSDYYKAAYHLAKYPGGGSEEALLTLLENKKDLECIRIAKRKAVIAERKARAAKAELKESNLFNAKLLYVTKLMQQHTLNNKQQRAIIEAMDNAKTQREAKLLFSSLNESLNKRASQKRTRRTNSRLTENRSRTGATSRSLRSGQAPNNSGVELDRWAVLAGLKK